VRSVPQPKFDGRKDREGRDDRDDFDTLLFWTNEER
jgi:hypothetical protein